jgi:hypothetical protein
MDKKTYKSEYYKKNKEKWKTKYNVDKAQYQKEWYEKNKIRLLEKQKQYTKNNKDKIKKYEQSQNGIKSHVISRWKKWDINGNLEEIYERYINTNKCDICNIVLTLDKKITSTRKCMDHNHITGDFRNVVCHKCNMTRKKIYCNNESGHKHIYITFNSANQLRYRHRTKRFKNIIDALCYKFICNLKKRLDLKTNILFINK